METAQQDVQFPEPQSTENGLIAENHGGRSPQCTSESLRLQGEKSCGNEEAGLSDERDDELAAWKVLCAAILAGGILAGFPLSFGVFQQYYQVQSDFPSSKQSAWIGVLSTGVPFMGAPFMTYICRRKYFSMQYYVAIGWILCFIALVAAAFCKSLLAIVLTQGLCYGVGIFILDVPLLLILNTWFLKRRGLAYGILFSLTDVFGLGHSYIANTMLLRYGLKITLLTFAAIIFVLPGFTIWLLKERQVETEPEPVSPQLDLPLPPIPNTCCGVGMWNGGGLTYYKRPIFYVLTSSNILQALAFYLPFIYLPSYTIDLGYSPTKATTVLAIANLAQIIGELCFGKMSDMMAMRGLCVLSSSLGASLAALLLWGLAKSYVQLIFFSISFGAFASGFIALWARIGTFFGEKDAENIYSVMSMGRGIGNVVSGPISAALLTRTDLVDRGAYALGKYAGVVCFVGVCMAGSSLLGAVGFFIIAREENVHKEKMRLQAAENDP